MKSRARSFMRAKAEDSLPFADSPTSIPFPQLFHSFGKESRFGYGSIYGSSRTRQTINPKFNIPSLIQKMKYELFEVENDRKKKLTALRKQLLLEAIHKRKLKNQQQELSHLSAQLEAQARSFSHHTKMGRPRK